MNSPIQHDKQTENNLQQESIGVHEDIKVQESVTTQINECSPPQASPFHKFASNKDLLVQQEDYQLTTFRSPSESYISERELPNSKENTQRVHKEFLEQIRGKQKSKVSDEDDYNFYDSSDDEKTELGGQQSLVINKEDLIKKQIEYVEPTECKTSRDIEMINIKSPRIYNLQSKLHQVNQVESARSNYRTFDKKSDELIKYKQQLNQKRNIVQRFWQITNSQHNKSKYDAYKVKPAIPNYFAPFQQRQHTRNGQIHKLQPSISYQEQQKSEYDLTIQNDNGTVRKMNMTLKPIQKRQFKIGSHYDFDLKYQKFRTRTFEDSQTQTKKFQSSNQSSSAKRQSVYEIIDMFMDQIDYQKEQQVFNTVNSKPKDKLQVKKIKLLGEGGQGFVYLVQIEGDDEIKLADKAFTIIQNREEATKCLEAQLQEFSIDLKHPNIIKYLYFMRKLNKRSDKHQFHLLMEHVDGNDLQAFVQNQIQKANYIQLENVKRIAGQLVSALHYLHQRLIVHLDIKPSNIMLDDEFKNLKLIDFGVSQIMEFPDILTRIALAGTYRYMPPEQHNEKVTLKSDIWSFGCVLFVLSTGLQPFEGMNEYAMCYHIATGNNPLKFAEQNSPKRKLKLINDNNDLKSLLQQCFNNSYTKRPSSLELYNHPFFSGYTTDMQSINQPNQECQNTLDVPQQMIVPIRNQYMNQSQFRSQQSFKPFDSSEQSVNYDSNIFFSRRTIDQIQKKFLKDFKTKPELQKINVNQFKSLSVDMRSKLHSPLSKQSIRKQNELSRQHSSLNSKMKFSFEPQQHSSISLRGSSIKSKYITQEKMVSRRQTAQFASQNQFMRAYQNINSSEFTFEIPQIQIEDDQYDTKRNTQTSLLLPEGNSTLRRDNILYQNQRNIMNPSHQKRDGSLNRQNMEQKFKIASDLKEMSSSTQYIAKVFNYGLKNHLKERSKQIRISNYLRNYQQQYTDNINDQTLEQQGPDGEGQRNNLTGHSSNNLDIILTTKLAPSDSFKNHSLLNKKNFIAQRSFRKPMSKPSFTNLNPQNQQIINQ